MTGSPDSIEQRLRTLQIMHAALAAGVVMFATIVLFLQQPAAFSGAPLIALRLACAGVLLMAIVLPMLLRGAAMRVLGAPDADVSEIKIFPHFFLQSLIRAAIIEGAGLLAAVTLLLSADQLDLIAVGAAMAFLIVAFPTHGKWLAFADDVRKRRGA